MNRRVLGIGLIIVLAVFAVYFGFRGKSEKNIDVETQAADHSATLSSQEDWTLGWTVNDNTNLDSPSGSVKISVIAFNKINTGSWTSNSITGELITKAHDSDVDTCFPLSDGSYIEQDFGEETNITQTVFNVDDVPPPNPGPWNITFQYWNGSSWAETITVDCSVISCRPYTYNFSPALTTTKVRIVNQNAFYFNVFEWSNFGGGNATHTSAPTQITNTDLYQWQTFTPHSTFSGTEANTSIKYNFRTSTNSTDWTDWSADQTVASGRSLDLKPLLQSWSGTESDPGTFYKYIQVKSTLTSSDGASTPIIEDYTIGYHTNVAPNKPAAGSVTIGS